MSWTFKIVQGVIEIRKDGHGVMCLAGEEAKEFKDSLDKGKGVFNSIPKERRKNVYRT